MDDTIENAVEELLSQNTPIDMNSNNEKHLFSRWWLKYLVVDYTVSRNNKKTMILHIALWYKSAEND